jgi:Domain of Unknown Function (DUF350)
LGVHLSLALIGVAKVIFGIVAGAAGIFCASRVLKRLMQLETGAERNTAAAVLEAAALVAFGIVMQHAATATFSAMDLMYRGQALEASMLGRFALYAFLHVGVSLVVATGALASGSWLFGRLTRGIDEVAEVRKGHVGPALVLGAVMIVMALMTSPGLQSILDGLLPLPVLARDEGVAPS